MAPDRGPRRGWAGGEPVGGGPKRFHYELSDLLGDEECEIVLTTGHTLAGHFYSTVEGATDGKVLLFVPSDAEPIATEGGV
jgi:hypothetical protein